MSCCDVSTNKNRYCQMKCDKNGAICLQTHEQSDVRLCLHDKNIMKCDDYQCSLTDSSKRQDKKSKCKYIPTEEKTCTRVCVGDNEENKLCGGSKCVSKEEEEKGIIEKKCAKKGHVSLPKSNKQIVYMCDTDDKECGKCNEECDCAESSSSEESSSSCSCVCMPCKGKENLCVGINLKKKVAVCKDCFCGQEEAAPEHCGNKKCKNKNCVCISTQGKSFVCIRIDDKGTIMCYSDCTCEADHKQNPSKSKPPCIRSKSVSCISVCLDDNRHITPRFDCSCKEDGNKEKNSDGCCCAHQESLPVLAFSEDTSVEVRKAIVEDRSTNTSCVDCLCEIPKCTSFNCICPPDTPNVTVVQKLNDLGESHDCNCPEPKGDELPKCCKR